jgi:CBS-domain-containing membrane protein
LKQTTDSHAVRIEDIKWALQQMDSVIDVSAEDIASIYQLAAEHAQA